MKKSQSIFLILAIIAVFFLTMFSFAVARNEHFLDDYYVYLNGRYFWCWLYIKKEIS